VRVAPPAPLVEHASVSTDDGREAFEQNWPECWEGAVELLEWNADYDSVLDGDRPPSRWFAFGEPNAAHNGVDSHLAERKSQVALSGSVQEPFAPVRHDASAASAAPRPPRPTITSVESALRTPARLP
jgi:hypothetical protein